MLAGSTILVTGGTGTFGQKFAEIALQHNPKTIRIFSRGELLQQQMAATFNDNRLRFFIGDIRDKDRLHRAMTNVGVVVHAAALKQVPACEYNPIEAIQTNITGAVNVIDCAIENKVDRVLAISSDKAVHPVNLYGSTKMVMERLFTQANVYSSLYPIERDRLEIGMERKPIFSCVRYGNVVGSRGSVIPIFKEQAKTGEITITDDRMTRFWMTIEQGVLFVVNCLSMMRGGEIFVPRIPSTSITDLADVIAPSSTRRTIGIRPGEKLHEVLLTEDEARHSREFEDYFVIQPEFPYWAEEQYWDLTGDSLPDGFRYSSDNNSQWLTENELRRVIE